MADDKSSWRGRAVHRRDERQTALPDIRPPSASKKDTKKWCRGKVGTPHKLVCKPFGELKNQSWSRDSEWKVLVCRDCDKVLEHWFPTPWRPRKEPKWAAKAVVTGADEPL
jgi:hypothetical protein